jgi:hypothetical protein
MALKAIGGRGIGKSVNISALFFGLGEEISYTFISLQLLFGVVENDKGDINNKPFNCGNIDVRLRYDCHWQVPKCQRYF